VPHLEYGLIATLHLILWRSLVCSQQVFVLNIGFASDRHDRQLGKQSKRRALVHCTQVPGGSQSSHASKDEFVCWARQDQERIAYKLYYQRQLMEPRVLRGQDLFSTQPPNTNNYPRMSFTIDWQYTRQAEYHRWTRTRNSGSAW
jgi:hypothetical protein